MDYINIISTVGFPIFMCGWFIWRQETILNKVNDSLVLVLDHLDRWEKK